jgi:Cu/Ag efflux protein CusF
MDNRADRARPRATIAIIILMTATALIAAADSETTRCTIRKVDPASREVTAVYGSGYALRVRVFRLDPDCRIAGLKPGQVVEVKHRRTGGRDVALSIAAVLPDENRGRP